MTTRRLRVAISVALITVVCCALILMLPPSVQVVRTGSGTITTLRSRLTGAAYYVVLKTTDGESILEGPVTSEMERDGTWTMSSKRLGKREMLYSNGQLIQERVIEPMQVPMWPR